MDDSPLSIAASITGILTFLAAIFGFVYLRYTVLKNGTDEMFDVFESVTATLDETEALLARISTIPGHGPGPGPDRLVRLIQDLYSTELFIMAQYENVFSHRNLDFKDSMDSMNSISSTLNRDAVCILKSNIQKLESSIDVMAKRQYQATEELVCLVEGLKDKQVRRESAK